MNYSAKAFNPVLPYYRERPDPPGFDQATRGSLGPNALMQATNSKMNFRPYEQPLSKTYSNYSGKSRLTQEPRLKQGALGWRT